MTILRLLPGSGDWLLAQLDAQPASKLRKELRRLQADLDAMFVGLWVTTTGGDVLVEFAGELAVAPERCPFITSTVPTFETFVGADGLQHGAVLHRPRLGRGMPRLGLLAADIPDLDVPVIFDAVEASGERIEEIFVGTIS